MKQEDYLFGCSARQRLQAGAIDDLEHFDPIESGVHALVRQGDQRVTHAYF